MPQPKSGTVDTRGEKESTPQPIHARFRHNPPPPPPKDEADSRRRQGSKPESSAETISLATSGMELHPMSFKGLSRRTPSSQEFSDEEEPALYAYTTQAQPSEVSSPRSEHHSVSDTLVASSSRVPPLASDSRFNNLDPKSTKTTIRPAIHHHKPSDPPPVGATTLFSKNAAPLSLPELDAYIESLPLPTFSTPTEGSRSSSTSRFPPFELLQNRSLADLKSNRTEPAVWSDRNTIFGVVSSRHPYLKSLLLITTPDHRMGAGSYGKYTPGRTVSWANINCRGQV